MKIAVAYYSERGNYSNPELVINLLKKYYNENQSVCRKEWGRELTCLLQKLDPKRIDICYIATKNPFDRMIIQEGIKSVAPNLIVSFNLAGFENVTLTDNYSYNLINIPQIHFCTDEEKRIVNNVLAINMFFAEL